MKYRYLLFIISIITLNTFAQVDRSKAPGAQPMKAIVFEKPARFSLPNGLEVLVVENHKQPIVTFSLSLDYKPFMEGELTGNSSVTGQLLRCGTKTKSKTMIDEQIDFIGASLSTSENGISASSLSRHKEQIAALISDILLNPTFPLEPLENIKNQMITSITANREDPEAIASNIATAVLYGNNHPYGEIITEQSIRNINQKSCQSFYKTYFKPNIATLVIVGDITLAEAQLMVKKNFSKWKKGKVIGSDALLPQPLEFNTVAIGNKPGNTQSTIKLTYTLDLKPNSPDRIKARVMDEILGGGSFQARLFSNLREKHAYTYGAYSDLSPDKYVATFGAYANVRAEITDSAFMQIIYEMNRLCTDTITDQELQLVKNSIAGSFGRALESPATVARFELDIKRNNLPADFYSTYLQNIDKVSKEDVQAMAKKYLKPSNALLIAVGDSATITPLLKKFGQNQTVNYYDFEGKKITK